MLRRKHASSPSESFQFACSYLGLGDSVLISELGALVVDQLLGDLLIVFRREVDVVLGLQRGELLGVLVQVLPGSADALVSDDGAREVEVLVVNRLVRDYLGAAAWGMRGVSRKSEGA